MTNCQNTTEQLPSGKYRHTCQVCGTVRIARGKRLVAECGSSAPQLCLPGCQLHRLLATIGIEPGGCNCESYANQMDAWGVTGCRERIGEIVEHLRGQAAERGLRFNATVAKWLVRLAIDLADQQRELTTWEATRLKVLALGLRLANTE